MVLSLAVAVMLSQKVQVIRSTPQKKAAKTETSMTAKDTGPTQEQLARESAIDAKSADLDAKADALNKRADALKEKDEADTQNKEGDNKAKQKSAKEIEKHARELQQEYERAANALAGQE